MQQTSGSGLIQKSGFEFGSTCAIFEDVGLCSVSAPVELVIFDIISGAGCRQALILLYIRVR